jgi:hypothetical protein
MTTFTEITMKVGNGFNIVSHPSGAGNSFSNGVSSITVGSVSSFPASGYISIVDSSGATQVLHYGSKSTAGFQSFTNLTGWSGSGNIEHGASVTEAGTPFTEVTIT